MYLARINDLATGPVTNPYTIHVLGSSGSDSPSCTNLEVLQKETESRMNFKNL